MDDSGQGRYSLIKVTIFIVAIILAVWSVFWLIQSFSNSTATDNNSTQDTTEVFSETPPKNSETSTSESTTETLKRSNTEISGIFVNQQQFGPPGFGENPSEDESLQIPVLYLTDSSKAKLRNIYPDAGPLDAVQLSLQNINASLDEGESYDIIGDSFLAHTGRHYYDIVLEVKSFSKSPPSTQVVDTIRPSPTEDEEGNEADEATLNCVPNSDDSQIYTSTRPDLEGGIKFQSPMRANLSAVPKFSHGESGLFYSEIFDGRELSLGSRFIDVSEWSCAEDVKVNFVQFDSAVNVVEDGLVKQSLLLSDIDIGNPYVEFSTFSDEYEFETLMWREQASTPALITEFDINFDGFNDLGILVDTGPIEDGYVFYMYDDDSDRYKPATLKSSPNDSFIIYQPTLDTEKEVLQGEFTVTNPRRTDYVEYRCDKTCIKQDSE